MSDAEDRRYHRLEVMSWQVAAHLLAYRRDLRVFNLHPGGGQYDVLSIRGTRGGSSMGTEICDLNRHGSVHVREGADRFDWPKRAADVPDFAARVAAAARLTPPAKPPKRPAPHVAAFIAEVLRRGGPAWRCMALLHDSSGMGDSGIAESLLEFHNGPREELRRRTPQSCDVRDPGYGWFALVHHDDDSVADVPLVIAMNGDAWLAGVQWPHARRNDWPACAAGLLERMALDG